MTKGEIQARINALRRYHFDLLRIGEPSLAAEREIDRVEDALRRWALLLKEVSPCSTLADEDN